MTQYYVNPSGGNDSNSGLSTSQAWATVSRAQQSPVSAGDIVNLMSGNHGGVTFSGSDVKGNSGNWITYRMYPSHGAYSAVFNRILFSGNYSWYIRIEGIRSYVTSSVPSALEVDAGSFVVFHDCKAGGASEGYGPTYAIVLFENNASYCTAQYCELYYGNYNCLAGVQVDSSDWCTVSHCYLHHIPQTGLRVGWDTEYENVSNGTVFEYNIIHTQVVPTAHGGSGVTIRCSNTTVRGNVIYNFGSTRPIRTYQGVHPETGYENIVIENNVVFRTDGYYGQVMWWVEFKDLGPNFILRNNTFGNYFESGWASAGCDISIAQYSYAASWKVYNNVIESPIKFYFPLQYVQNIDEGNGFYGQLWVDGSRYYSGNAVWPGSNSVVGGSFAEDVMFEDKEKNYPFGSVYPFELCTGSPAINFGKTSEAPTLDLLERSRVGQADSGAYEFEGGAGGDTKTFSVGAVIQDLSLTKTFTVDSQLAGRYTKECTAGARLEALLAVAFSINGVLHASGLTKVFTLASQLVNQFTKSATVNAQLGRIKAFTLGAQLTAPEVYDTLWIDFTSDKLFWIDGQFTSTINDEQDISGVTGQPRGISATTTSDILWCEGGDGGLDKLHLQSGRFTSTIKDSLLITNWNGRPQDCSLDDNGDVVWCGDGESGNDSSLYLHSGLFTSTLKTSQPVSGDAVGCSFDINGNVPWIESSSAKLLLTSGEFTSTIKTSLVISAIETGPRGISWNGLGETMMSGIEADKLYKFSGQFTTTLHDSESVAVASPQGIDTTDWFTRINGAPSSDTKTFSVDAVLYQSILTKIFTVGAQAVDRLTKILSTDSYLLNRLTKTATVSAQVVKQETKECTADTYLVHALNLVTNGHFSFWTADDPDDWTVYIVGGESETNYVDEDNGRCHLVSSGTAVGLTHVGILEYGTLYKVRFNIASITGSMIVSLGGTITSFNSTGQKDFIVQCGILATDLLFMRNGACDVVFDNVEVYSIGKTFELDSQLVDRLTKEFTIGARIVDRYTKECTADARLGGIKTFTAGARLTESDSKTFEIDATLQGPLTKTCTASVALQDQSLTKTYTANGYLVDRYTKTFAVNSQVVDRSIKACLIGAGLVRLKACTANAYLVDRFVKALTANAYLVGKKTFTADAQIVNVSTKTCTAGAYLVRKKELIVGYQLVSRPTVASSLDARLMDRYTKECTVDVQIEVQPVKPTIIGALVIDRSILAVTINTKVVTRNLVTLTGNAQLGHIKICNADAHLTTELTKTAMAILVLESSLGIDEPVDLFQSTH